MNTKQIAEEARKQIWLIENEDGDAETKAAAIIEAAIEKAIAQHHFKDRKPEVSGKFLLSRAAHASVDVEYGEGFSIERPKKPAHASEPEIENAKLKVRIAQLEGETDRLEGLVIQWKGYAETLQAIRKREANK